MSTPVVNICRWPKSVLPVINCMCACDMWQMILYFPQSNWILAACKVWKRPEVVVRQPKTFFGLNFTLYNAHLNPSTLKAISATSHSRLCEVTRWLCRSLGLQSAVYIPDIKWAETSLWPSVDTTSMIKEEDAKPTFGRCLVDDYWEFRSISTNLTIISQIQLETVDWICRLWMMRISKKLSHPVTHLTPSNIAIFSEPKRYISCKVSQELLGLIADITN